MKNTKPWHKCPECGAKTILFVHPHEFAGVWECQNPKCGASDSCDHEKTHTESVQVDYWPTPDIDQSYDVDVAVCDDCELTLEEVEHV